MLFNRIPLLRHSEFEFCIHSSLVWEIILISWTLATGIFPYYYKYLYTFTYWWMGIVGAVALIFSVLVHEIFCIILWCKLGLPFKEVTLFLFGAVTDADIIRGKISEELLVVICGFLINILLAFFLHCILIIGQAKAFPIEILGVIEFARMINMVLAVINIFPLLPLEGGRIVLVILNRFFVNVDKVSRFFISAATIVGLIIMTAGILLCLKGYIQGGVWWILFGMYLREGAGLIYRKYLIQEMLKKETAGSVMTRNPVSVLPDLSVNTFVQQYLYNFHFKMFPVIKDDCKLHSVLFSRNAFDLPQKDWGSHVVGEIATMQLSEITVLVEADVLSVMAQMHETGQSRVVVVDSEQRLQGVIVLKDLLMYLSAKMNL